MECDSFKNVKHVSHIEKIDLNLTKQLQNALKRQIS